jgi:class 3 adenylate cyclase
MSLCRTLRAWLAHRPSDNNSQSCSADLAGSTELSARYDPEDLSDIVRGYQNTTESVVDRYAGHIALYMSDGILIYFGYPRAHEDYAKRALRAGLDIIREVFELEPRRELRLHVRIGVATGSVVVGETIGSGSSREQVALGEMPNLAAWLQSIAEPNRLIIGPTTHQLVGDRFDCESIGLQSLKGFVSPVECWRITGVRALDERYRRPSNSAVVAREQDMTLLLERCRLAIEGNGQVVLITGEPGIGKSRIIDAARDQIELNDVRRIVFRCSPYDTHSALHSVRAHLQRVVGLSADDSTKAQWES